MTLKVTGLRYAYKKQEVLKGVDFSAELGQCICLLGENGAGKTTLFRCLLGFLRGYGGEILIDQVDSSSLSIPEMAKKIAYIPQSYDPTFNYSVFETVLMGTNTQIRSFHTPGDSQRETVWEMLELMNITHLAERGCAEISGGERQLVLIARALAQKSRILVMDEPTANLDYGNQFRVMRQVKQLAERGYLVVLSTHNPEHALVYAHKVLVIREGISALYGEPIKVLTPEVIKQIYGVCVELQTLQAAGCSVPVFVPCLNK